MDFVVIKREKRCGLPGEQLKDFVMYYAGYECESWSQSGPIFNRTITPKAVFSEAIADAIVKQLTEMGHKVQKEPRYKRPPSYAKAS